MVVAARQTASLIGIAWILAGCASTGPTTAEIRASEIQAASNVASTSLVNCMKANAAANPMPEPIWDGNLEAVPLLYLSSEGFLSDDDKLILITRVDGSVGCLAAYGNSVATIDSALRTLTNIYIDNLQKITLALLQDQIPVGKFHELVKANAQESTVATQAVFETLNSDLTQQHQSELVYREASRAAAVERFQRSLLNSAAIVNSGMPNSSNAMPAATTMPNTVSKPIGFFSHSETSGMNRICYYNSLGSLKAITISAASICPLTN